MKIFCKQNVHFVFQDLRLRRTIIKTFLGAMALLIIISVLPGGRPQLVSGII